jgi:hypothetical protein
MMTMEQLAYVLFICLGVFMFCGLILIIYDVINEADDYENDSWE